MTALNAARAASQDIVLHLDDPGLDPPGTTFERKTLPALMLQRMTHSGKTVGIPDGPAHASTRTSAPWQAHITGRFIR
jgi:hypothetical protein